MLTASKKVAHKLVAVLVPLGLLVACAPEPPPPAPTPVYTAPPAPVPPARG